MSKQSLWRLRQQVHLGSSKATDYSNNMGLDPIRVKTFFDGFYAFIRRKAKKNPYCNNAIDARAFYDNATQLWDYHGVCKTPLAM